jgi:hypothetical protein
MDKYDYFDMADETVAAIDITASMNPILLNASASNPFASVRSLQPQPTLKVIPSA